MVRDRQGLGWLGKLIVLLVLGGLYAGIVSYVLLAPLPSPYTPPLAETGDAVSVDYRGFFPDNARTFDTSIQAVAKDNATYPKAASFTFRTGTSQYQPLAFTLGCSGSGCPLVGFQNAVRGLRVGEHRTFELAPQDAYGVSNPAKIHVRPLTEDVNVTMTFNATRFQAYFGTGAIDGTTVADPDWGWNTTVHVSGDLVTTRAGPTVGQVLTVGGKWHARVLSIDDAANGGIGVVTVQHLLTASDVRAFVAKDHTGNFLVTAVDVAGQTFTTDYNSEVVGRTLAFEITVVSITKAIP